MDPLATPDRPVAGRDYPADRAQFREFFPDEAAFALADAWLAFCLVAGARALAGRRATALLWLLAMDVLYNLQHGVWFASQRGLLELVRNLATGAGTIALFVWTWPRRAQLLAGD